MRSSKNLLSRIIFEDEYFVAVDKPAGILTVPGRFNADEPSVLSILKLSYPEIIPVHRLDKYTSGVNLFAKNAKSHQLMSVMFEERKVEKYYVAIVDGVPFLESGRIDVPLAESQTTRGKMLVHKRGKPSVTEYKIIKNYGNYSYLYLRLFTGRMHQIRVHLQYLGNPLIVDSLYGRQDTFYLSEIKRKKFSLGKYETEKPLLTRQPLHAIKLAFVHPYTHSDIAIEADLPKDIKAVLNQMDKWIVSK